MRARALHALTGAAVAWLAVSTVHAAPVQQRGIFVYSTLCVGTEDEAGEQFVVMRLASGPVVTYTYAEGPVMAPVLAYGSNAEIDDRTGKVHFRFELVDSPSGKPETIEFRGTITAELLTLTRERGPELRLPRSPEVRDKLPRCARGA
jgi:hypothetical protein